MYGLSSMLVVSVLLTRCLVGARYIDYSMFHKGRNIPSKAEVQRIGLYLHMVDSVGKEGVTSSTKTIARQASCATVSSVVDRNVTQTPKTFAEAIAALQGLGKKYVAWQKRVIALAREAIQSQTIVAFSGDITIIVEATTTVDDLCTKRTASQKRTTRRPRTPKCNRIRSAV